MERQASTGTSSQLPSISTLFSQTWEYYKTHWKLLTAIQAPSFIIAAVSILSNIVMPSSAMTLLYALASMVASGLSWLALTWVIAKEKDVEWKVAFQESLKYAIPAFVIALLTFVIVLGGFILLIIPGIYLAISYSFVHFSLFAEDKQGMDALRASKFYVNGYWWKVVWRMFVLGVGLGFIQIVLSFIGIAPQWESIRDAAMNEATPEATPASALDIIGTGFATLVSTPLSTIYSFLLYKALRGIKGEYTPQVK